MDTPDEPPASGIPALVLGAGLLAAIFGTAVLLAHQRHPIDGVVPFLVPVIVLGLMLIGLWAKWNVRGELGPPIRVGEVPANVPGPWYLVAIVGIAVLLMLRAALHKKL